MKIEIRIDTEDDFKAEVIDPSGNCEYIEALNIDELMTMVSEEVISTFDAYTWADELAATDG